MIKIKILKSTVKDEMRIINPPKKSFWRFAVLIIVGLIVGYIGFGVGGLIGFITVLGGVACIIASFMQIIGTSKCVCPNCETEGYIYKYAKNYKCPTCKLTSVVIEQDEDASDALSSSAKNMGNVDFDEKSDDAE